MIKARKTRLIRVSRISPYRNCKVGGPGTNFVNTAVEPWLAIGPATAENGKPLLIGVWQQDRWSNGGARGLVAAFSRDGGRTWKQRTLPFSKCAVPHLKYKRASDPVVSIGPDGKAYAVALSVTVSKTGTQVAESAITAATSSDGGKTWGNFRVIQSDKGPNIINDKETVIADPSKPGTAYVVWDRVTPVSGPAFFSKTTDGEIKSSLIREAAHCTTFSIGS
ncbi:sialidase family protein [Ferviditalea candida]|uniref:Sialidase family protein n=1 Tax=Ferviditalea candida TaxID=3108399 RepID=A0ABU5ZP76_9BACL|nr:sialidase family protein [Paenibacillaceae bacterium T2]